jgi:hypothetical protein
MATGSNMFARLRKQPPAIGTSEAAPSQNIAARSPEQIIAGCEYELRQVRRDVLQTRKKATPPPALKPSEPFVLGARLRGLSER